MAGLSLLYRAMEAGLWKNERIIVADRAAKNENDRTWSFWQQQPGPFDQLVSHRWNRLMVYGHEGQAIPLAAGPYTYNSIRSIDFYRFTLDYLSRFPNISFVQAEIISFSSADGCCRLVTPENTYTARYLFNSIYRKPELLPGQQYFLQHFKGLKIKTSAPLPDQDTAFLMDFRTGQQQGATFFYTLPVSATEIFVEYTLFSKHLLPDAVYDAQLQEYLTHILGISSYTILEQETGAIPMTDHLFPRTSGNIIHLGSAGGDTRASTGYTFTNTQKTIGKILSAWVQTGKPFFKTETVTFKQQLYDSTLLNVLDRGKYPGHRLFTDLFLHCPAYRIFPFLDGESTLPADLPILSALRWQPFLQAFLKTLWRRLFQ